MDENYEQTEAEWDEIKKEILGEVEDVRMNKQGAGMIRPDAESESESEEEDIDKNVSFNLMLTLCIANSRLH